MEKIHSWYCQLKPYSCRHSMSFNQFRNILFYGVKFFIFTLFFTFCFFPSAFAQIKTAKAEMVQYNYPKAIEILHQFIQKADPKTKEEATLLMADCYRLQNDMQDARAWYFKALRLGNTSPLTYFYYAKALRACGDYENAKRIFLQYDSLMPDDHRGKIYASFCDSAMAWDEKPYAFEVNNARNLNSTSSEFGPVFYNDGVLFASDRVMTTEEEKKSGWAGHGYLKLVFATPKQKDDYYGEYNLPRLAQEFYNSGVNDGPATFSKDGNEVFFTRATKSTDKSKEDPEEGQANQLKIFSATKVGDKWSKLKPFFFNSNNYSVGYPALSPDGGSLYFVSDVAGGYGGTDLYVTTRDGEKWSAPVNLGPIVNTFGDETFPFMAENGDLYFASDGHPGYGGLDIFVTRKVGNVWLNPQNLGKPINSSYDDFALAMYKNDSVGLFSANRPGGRGEDDIYSFRVVGPLPALTTQPAIASVNPVIQQESKPEINKVPKVTPQPETQLAVVTEPNVTEQPGNQPATITETNVNSQKESNPEVINVPAINQQQETQPAVAEVQKVSNPPAAENVVPVSAPVTTEATPPKQQEIQPALAEAQKVSNPPAAEKVVTVSATATAEATQPSQQTTQPAVAEVQKVSNPPAAESVVPVSAPVTAEVTPSSQQTTQPVVAEAQKVSNPSAENVVPVSAQVTAEVTPSQQQQESSKETKANSQPESQLAFTTETKVTPQPETKPEVINAIEVTPKQGTQPVAEVQKETSPPATENVIPVTAPVTAEVTPPQQQVSNPSAEVQKETNPSAENLVPVPAPVTAEVNPPRQQTGMSAETNNYIGNNSTPKVLVSGCIKDGTTKDPIAATVFFLDENKGKVVVHKANTMGCFKSELLAGINYQIKAMQTGYSSDCVPFFSDISGGQMETRISNDLLLEKTGVTHTYRVDNIYYDFDRYFIRSDAEPSLNKLVQIMNENPVTVELGSHADCRGSVAYNMILTEKRTASAFNYIVQKGISGSRIISRWYGKSQLVNNCNCTEGVYCTEEQHQANRRTEFKISLPALSLTEPTIDLDKYNEGDTIDLRVFPPDFFKNCNHRMLSGPLAELLNSSTLLPQEQNTGIVYTVQIGAFSYLTPHFDNLSAVMSCKGSDGILRCFVGKFYSKEEAVWFRDHLRSGEFKDAFVAVMDERHNPSSSNPMAYLSKR